MNIWITGASSGIGKELALLYAENGHTVFASARNADALDQLATDTASLQGEIIALACDVTNDESVSSAFNTMQMNTKLPDLVVLNAGFYEPVEFDDLTLEHFEKTLDVNLRGVIRCMLPALQLFKKTKKGHVAIVSSVSGYRGLPKAAAYGASKAALINMAESLKPECNANGIKLSLINPGFVKSKLTDQNKFAMPFILEPRDAAERIEKGLASNAFEITFPRRFTWGLKLLRILPYRLYFFVTAKMVK